MTGIAPTPDNFRAEIARHRLTREVICRHIGMHVNELSNFINELYPMHYWAAHNIGYAINKETGIRIFEIEMLKGVLKPYLQPRVRDIRTSVRLPTPPKKRRYRRKKPA